MSLKLSPPFTVFGGGGAELVVDDQGPFESVRTTNWVKMFEFTNRSHTRCIVKMDYTRGSSDSTAYKRAIEMRPKGGNAFARAVWGYADSRAGNYPMYLHASIVPGMTFEVYVRSGQTSSSDKYHTSPTRFRVWTWSE